jgi:hypothetical protein
MSERAAGSRRRDEPPDRAGEPPPPVPLIAVVLSGALRLGDGVRTRGAPPEERRGTMPG